MIVPRRELIDALKSTFSVSELDNMLATRLNRNREWIIAGVANTTFEDIVTAVVLKAEQRGWVRDLVRGALEASPTSPRLRALIQNYPQLDPATAQPALETYRSMFLRGQRVFLKRDDFREALQIIGHQNQSRVIAIDGDRGFGKTYSKEFLYFLRDNEPTWLGTNQQIIYVYLDQAVFQPEDLARVIGRRFGLQDATLPPGKGEQAPRRIPDLIDWLTGGLQASAVDMFWLVLDGFRVQVQPDATHDLIRALIDATDRDWGRVRLLLLNYGKHLDLDTGVYILSETIKPIERTDVEDFFAHVYSESKKHWEPADIKQTVDNLFSQVEAEVANRGPDVRTQLLSVGMTRAAKNLLR